MAIAYWFLLYSVVAVVLGYSFHDPEVYAQTPHARTALFLVALLWPLVFAIGVLLMIGLGIAMAILYPLVRLEEYRQKRRAA
jgi:hypothetical protein